MAERKWCMTLNLSRRPMDYVLPGNKSVLWKRRHLWLYLLALGFNPKKYFGNVFLGENMFDKPNNLAFHTVVIFLFTKLDRSRAEKNFGKYRDSLSGNPADYEFRKLCISWIRCIAIEKRIYLPQVTASSLLCPGGPKFVELLYCLARYVVFENMKKKSIGTGIPFAEAVNLRSANVHIANARRRVARNKLVQIFKKQDLINQEYEKKAQFLWNEIIKLKNEYSLLHVQSCRMKQTHQNKDVKSEKIQKVRSMWTLIMQILTSLKKEKEHVNSVLEAGNGQWILNGTRVFRIPQLLLHRIENHIDQLKLCTGNLYEDNNLNFLTVIQLLNEALRTLRDEQCLSELKQLPVFGNRVTVFKELLDSLTAKRIELEHQHCVSTSGSICRKQEDLELKWKNFLGPCSLNLLLGQDPVLDCLRALQPHSFNLAEDCKSNFYQHPVSNPYMKDSPHGVQVRIHRSIKLMVDKSTSPLKRTSSVSLELSEASENREVSVEKILPVETCKYEQKPVPQETLKNGKDESATSEMQKNAGDNVIQTKTPVKWEDPLEKARDDLAEEVANTVMSESPQSSEGRSMKLEELTSILAFDPFLTRKQIPRTPENLLTEIRSSWRKAIQTEGLSDIELAPTEAMTEKSPMDARLGMQKTSDSRFMCSIHASPVFDFESLSENKSQLSSTELKPQKQFRPVIDSPVLETSGMQESEKIEAQELKCIVSNKNSVEHPEENNFQYVKILTTPDTCSERSSTTNVLPSDHFRGSLKDGVLHWNISSLSSVISEDGSLGILDETLPEELYSTDLSRSSVSENNSSVTACSFLTDGSENEDDTMSKLDLLSPFNTCNVLKKTASRSEVKLHQTHNEAELVHSRSKPNIATEKREDEMYGPLKLFCLDEEFTKTPLPESGNERKYSLSSVLVSCQHVEEMASVAHEIPFDLNQKLKEKLLLNEKPGIKEPSSG